MTRRSRGFLVGFPPPPDLGYGDITFHLLDKMAVDCNMCKSLEDPDLREDCDDAAEVILPHDTTLAYVRVTGCCLCHRVGLVLCELTHAVFQRVATCGVLLLVNHDVAEQLRGMVPDGVATCTPIARGVPIFVVPRGMSAMDRVLQAADFLVRYNGHGIVILSHGRINTADTVDTWRELTRGMCTTVMAPITMSATCARLVLRRDGKTPKVDNLILYSIDSVRPPPWLKRNDVRFAEFGDIEAEMPVEDGFSEDDDEEIS